MENNNTQLQLGELYPAVKEEIKQMIYPEEVKSLSFAPLEAWGEQGTRSDTYRVVTEGSSKDYIIKRYLNGNENGSYKDFITEKAVLKIGNDKMEGLFPKLLSYNNEEFNKRKMLLLEIVNKDTLEQTIAKKREKNEKVSFREAEWESALDPLVRLHRGLYRHLGFINQELNSLSNGKFKELEIASPEEYKTKFSTALGKVFGEIPLDARDEIAGKFFDLSHGINKKEYESIIQFDGYPWHNTLTSLIDAGCVKVGSCAHHIGSLFGNSIFYSVLENPREALSHLATMYLIKVEKERYPAETKKEINLKDFEKAIYTNSVFLNVYASAGSKRNNLMNGNIKSAIKQQLEYLKEFDDAREFSSSFLKYLV